MYISLQSELMEIQWVTLYLMQPCEYKHHFLYCLDSLMCWNTGFYKKVYVLLLVYTLPCIFSFFQYILVQRTLCTPPALLHIRYTKYTVQHILPAHEQGPTINLVEAGPHLLPTAQIIVHVCQGFTLHTCIYPTHMYVPVHVHLSQSMAGALSHCIITL